MKTSSKGIGLIKLFEGLKLEAYVCSGGKQTIGWGHTRTARKGMRITPAQAEALLTEDLTLFERGILKSLHVPLSQSEFDALVSFTFNLGINAFKHSTLKKKIEWGDRKGAADEFLKWVHAGGEVLPGLVTRRRAERELFLLRNWDEE